MEQEGKLRPNQLSVVWAEDKLGAGPLPQVSAVQRHPQGRGTLPLLLLPRPATVREASLHSRWELTETHDWAMCRVRPGSTQSQVGVSQTPPLRVQGAMQKR